MRRFARRCWAGLKACWTVPGGSYPSGTYALLFVAACWCLTQSCRQDGKVNIVDLVMSLALGYLMVSSFWHGYIAGGDSAPK